jgi:hypothetical protein
MTKILVLISTRRIWRSTRLQWTLGYKLYPMLSIVHLCTCSLTLFVCLLFVCCCLFSSCSLFWSRFSFVSESCGECVRNWVNCLRILYSVYFLFDGFVLYSTLLNGKLLSCFVTPFISHPQTTSFEWWIVWVVLLVWMMSSYELLTSFTGVESNKSLKRLIQVSNLLKHITLKLLYKKNSKSVNHYITKQNSNLTKILQNLIVHSLLLLLLLWYSNLIFLCGTVLADKCQWTVSRYQYNSKNSLSGIWQKCSIDSQIPLCQFVSFQTNSWYWSEMKRLFTHTESSGSSVDVYFTLSWLQQLSINNLLLYFLSCVTTCCWCTEYSIKLLMNVFDFEILSLATTESNCNQQKLSKFTTFKFTNDVNQSNYQSMFRKY